MTSSPEDRPHDRWSVPESWPADPAGSEESETESIVQPDAPGADFGTRETTAAIEPPRFDLLEPPPRIERIPNFGHLAILCAMLVFGLLCSGLVIGLALAHHLYGVTGKQGALNDVHYELGSEAILYLVTLGECLLIFPMVWHRSFFAGIQWNGVVAVRRAGRLVTAAGGCLLLALLSSLVMPGPKQAPIEKLFQSPGAAWVMFAFGVTFAPFFEETFFRGFLLPALATAVDWFAEKVFHQPRLPLAANGHPQWSMTAMTTAAIATSVPFAFMHFAQTGRAIGPFFLLIGISLILCMVRFVTRSLASSVLVHAVYNFILFSMMLIGTQGFRHFEKM